MATALESGSKGRKCLRWKKVDGKKRCAKFGDTDDIEYPPIEDGMGFLDFGWLPTMEDLKSIGIAGGAAGVGMIAVDEAFNRIDFLSRRNVAIKAISKMVLGVAGGKALTYVHPAAGAGLGAGLVGDAVRDLVNAYVFKRGTTAAATEGLSEEEEEILLGDEEEEILLGEGEEELPMLGEGEEEEILLGGSRVGEEQEVGAITEDAELQGYMQTGAAW